MSFSPTHRRPDLDGLLRRQRRDDGRRLFRRKHAMAVHESYFIETKHLRKGMRVDFVSRQFGRGTGTIKMIWLGIEEMVDVRMSDGRVNSLCPALGDVITPAQDVVSALGNVRPPRPSLWQRLIGRLFRRDRAAARAGFEQQQTALDECEERT